MADERSDYQTVAEEEERGAPEERRRSSGLLFAVIAVVFVILVLLLLRGCQSVQHSVSRRSSTNQIVPVEGRAAIDGEVSVWVQPGDDIQNVIKRSGVHVLDVVDMNNGRYVFTVKPGTEVDAARAIRGLSNVYDAGRVYQGE